MRIYIAGPYTPSSNDKHECIREAAFNVDIAIQVALELIELGHYPFVPHLSHYLHVNPACKRDFGQDFYYQYDNSFLYHWAEALYYIAPSRGADAELELAKILGLEVFYSLDKVPRNLKSKTNGEKK